MPGPQAVGSTAVARAEVRKSLDRLEHHLARGVKGVKGVRREVAYLDALHRQTVRNAGRAVGRPYTGRPAQSFGAKAAQALGSGNTRTTGRMRSSILADFSSDGLQPARDWTRGGDTWVWVANGSACPSCLSKHGQKHRGAFVPSHPSCLCIPETEPQAAEYGVAPLSHDALVSVAREYGDPRYYSKLKQFEDGLISFDDLAQIENINGQARGLHAYQQHLAKGEVRQTALGGSAPPTPAPQPAPTPKPQAKDPHPPIDLEGLSPRTLREILDGGLDDVHYDTGKVRAQIQAHIKELEKAVAKADDFSGLTSKEISKKRTELYRSGKLDDATRSALNDAQILAIKREADEAAARLAAKADELYGAPKPQTFKQRWDAWKKGTEPDSAGRPDSAAIREEIEGWIQGNIKRRLGAATNAERYAEMERMTSFSDEIADGYKAARTQKAKLKLLEDEAQARWPLTADGHETLFDFGGMHPEIVKANLDNLFDLAQKFPVPAERLRYIGTYSDPFKMWGADTGTIYRNAGDNAFNRLFTSSNPNYWATKDGKGVYAYVTDGQGARALGSEGSSGTIMAINPSMGFKKVEDLMLKRRRDVRVGFHPQGTDSLTSVLTHEYGHLVDYWMDDIVNVLGKSYGSVGDIKYEFEALRKSIPEVSEYAKKNAREKWAEHFSGMYERGEFDSDEWKAFEKFWTDHADVR